MADLSTCTICKLEFKTVLKKKIHEQQVHVFIFQCDICQTKYKTREDLDIHKEKNHKILDEEPDHCNKVIKEIVAVECSSCEELFKSESELREHETKEHFPTVIAVECQSCKELFKSEEDLEEHTSREHPPTIEANECAYCDELFKNEVDLDVHVKSEHNTRVEETSVKNENNEESESNLSEPTNEVVSVEVISKEMKERTKKTDQEVEINEPGEPELVTKANDKIDDKEKVRKTTKDNFRIRKKKAFGKKKRSKNLSFDIEEGINDESLDLEQKEKIKQESAEEKSLASRKKELKKKKRKMSESNLDVIAEKKRKFENSDHSKEEKMIKCTQYDLDELTFKATQIDNIRKHEQILLSKLEYLKSSTRKIPNNDEEDVTLEVKNGIGKRTNTVRDDYIDDQDVKDVLENLSVTTAGPDQHSLKIEPVEVTTSSVLSPTCKKVTVSFVGEEVPDIQEISEWIVEEEKKDENDKLVELPTDPILEDVQIQNEDKFVSQDGEKVDKTVVKTKEFKKRKVKEMEEEHKKLRKRLEELQKKKMKKGRIEELPKRENTSLQTQEFYLHDKIDILDTDQDQDLELKDPEDYIQQLQQLYKKKNPEVSSGSQAFTLDDNGEVEEIKIEEQNEDEEQQEQVKGDHVKSNLLYPSLNIVEEQKVDDSEVDRDVQEINFVGNESEKVSEKNFGASIEDNYISFTPSTNPNDGEIKENKIWEKESENISSSSNTIEEKEEGECVVDDDLSIFSLQEKSIPDLRNITNEGFVNNFNLTNHLPMDLDLSDSDSDSETETKSVTQYSGDFSHTNEASKPSKPESVVDVDDSLSPLVEPVEFMVDQPAPQPSTIPEIFDGFSIFDIDQESPEPTKPSEHVSIHENNSLDLLRAAPSPDHCLPNKVPPEELPSDNFGEPQIEHKVEAKKSKTIIEIQPMPLVNRSKKRGRPKKIKVEQEENSAVEIQAPKYQKEIIPKKRGRPKKVKESEDFSSKTEAMVDLDIKQEIKPKRGRGRPRKNKDEEITSRNMPSYLPTLVDGYAADIEDSNFTSNPSINQDNHQNSGEVLDKEVESSVAQLQKELFPIVDDFNSITDVFSLGEINLYPAESDGTLSHVGQPYTRDWTPVKAQKQSPSTNVDTEPLRMSKEEDKVDLGFLQVLSDSDEDDNDANDNIMQEAGFMALLSDSEDETNNNDKQVGKEEKKMEDATKEVSGTVPFQLPEDKQNAVTESDPPEPMHTLFRAKYDVVEDTRRPYNKWISDVSIGAGWKMKRKGSGIIYKDKKGSIFKSRFRALKHYISSQNLKPNLIEI